MRTHKLSFTAALLLASVPALAHGDDRDRDRDRQRQNQQARGRQDFYSGLRRGGSGGQYYEPRHANDGYNQQHSAQYNQPRGGIGPGKGALIGGAGGAILGTVLGGGLKGTLIGGAAGAGIGAVVGQTVQNRRRSSYPQR